MVVLPTKKIAANLHPLPPWYFAFLCCWKVFSACRGFLSGISRVRLAGASKSQKSNRFATCGGMFFVLLFFSLPERFVSSCDSLGVERLCFLSCHLCSGENKQAQEKAKQDYLTLTMPSTRQPPPVYAKERAFLSPFDFDTYIPPKRERTARTPPPQSQSSLPALSAHSQQQPTEQTPSPPHAERRQPQPPKQSKKPQQQVFSQSTGANRNNFTARSLGRGAPYVVPSVLDYTVNAGTGRRRRVYNPLFNDADDEQRQLMVGSARYHRVLRQAEL